MSKPFNKPSKRALLLIDALCGSGAPKSFSMVVNFLANNGYETYVFSTTAKAETIHFEPNVHHIISCFRNKSRLFQRIQTLIEIFRINRAIKPDVAITFIPMYILPLLKRKGKLVFSDRGIDIHNSHFGLYKRLASLCDYVVFQTPYNAIAYDNLAKEKIRIIPNAIPPLSFEIEPYKSRDVKRGKISCTGRLHIKQKRQDVLIAAMAIVHEKQPHAVLSIYGEGPDRQVLEKQIADLDASKYVILEGFSKNVSRDIYDSELFVLSSDYEGLPNSLIEAMQLELPCVSTDCLPGGARYLLEDGAGVLVQRDNPSLLADAICKLLENERMCHDLSTKAKDRVSEFSEQNIFQKWEYIWSN